MPDSEVFTTTGDGSVDFVGDIRAAIERARRAIPRKVARNYVVTQSEYAELREFAKERLLENSAPLVGSLEYLYGMRIYVVVPGDPLKVDREETLFTPRALMIHAANGGFEQ
jgi:hypothetical protein